MLERIVNNNPDLRSKVCYLACLVFQRQNEKTQLRAAGLIEKYGDREDENLKSMLKVQMQILTRECRKKLSEFFV